MVENNADSIALLYSCKTFVKRPVLTALYSLNRIQYCTQNVYSPYSTRSNQQWLKQLQKYIIYLLLLF
jgi:hypothetical protein